MKSYYFELTRSLNAFRVLRIPSSSEKEGLQPIDFNFVVSGKKPTLLVTVWSLSKSANEFLFHIATISLIVFYIGLPTLTVLEIFGFFKIWSIADAKSSSYRNDQSFEGFEIINSLPEP